jgi:predicted dehydrogenase
VVDELWEKTTVNNMWARSFVRLMRDFVGILEGRSATGAPATFQDGLAVQRVMDAARASGRVRLD